MNNLYDALTLLEVIPLGIMMTCLILERFDWCKAIPNFKHRNTITHFCSVVILLLFNVVQLIMEISLEKSIFFSVFLIVTWSLAILVAWSDFKHEISKE